MYEGRDEKPSDEHNILTSSRRFIKFLQHWTRKR